MIQIKTRGIGETKTATGALVKVRVRRRLFRELRMGNMVLELDDIRVETTQNKGNIY